MYSYSANYYKEILKIKTPRPRKVAKRLQAGYLEETS